MERLMCCDCGDCGDGEENLPKNSCRERKKFKERGQSCGRVLAIAFTCKPLRKVLKRGLKRLRGLSEPAMV